MKSKREIEDVLNRVDEFGASKFPGMSYEEGVSAALRWVLDEIEEDPLED